MNTEIFEKLKEFDTPTICNAIEIAQGKRGFDRFTRGTVICSSHEDLPMVGYARTARIAGAIPSLESKDTIRSRRMDYYRYMAESPPPAIVVIQDDDFPNCVGAFWGEINVAVHKGFGMVGVLTDGVMRDLDSLDDRFPVVAGSIGPSHAHVHVKSFNETIRVFGMEVRPDELIHADRHGAVVIPDAILNDLLPAIEKLQNVENIILEPTKTGTLNFATFEESWKKFDNERV